MKESYEILMISLLLTIYSALIHFSSSPIVLLILKYFFLSTIRFFFDYIINSQTFPNLLEIIKIAKIYQGLSSPIFVSLVFKIETTAIKGKAKTTNIAVSVFVITEIDKAIQKSQSTLDPKIFSLLSRSF